MTAAPHWNLVCLLLKMRFRRIQLFRCQSQEMTNWFTGMVRPSVRMKRNFEELVSYLYRECSFENGCYLMTGTCLVPPEDFTLAEGDEIKITINPIGSLINSVSFNPDKNYIL